MPIEYFIDETEYPDIDSPVFIERQKIKRELRGGIHRFELPDGELTDGVEEAEDDLLDAVHKICGMNEFTISEDILNGSLEQKWDPRKIDVIREYLQDSSVILKKMFSLFLDGDSPDDPAPEKK